MIDKLWEIQDYFKVELIFEIGDLEAKQGEYEEYKSTLKEEEKAFATNQNINFKTKK